MLTRASLLALPLRRAPGSVTVQATVFCAAPSSSCSDPCVDDPPF